jgi:hypothetical protein
MKYRISIRRRVIEVESKILLMPDKRGLKVME